MAHLMEHSHSLAPDVCVIIRLPHTIAPPMQMPLWALVAFGLYSLCSIAYSLVVFRDVPEEFAVLRKDIADAREELTAKGFKFS